MSRRWAPDLAPVLARALRSLGADEDFRAAAIATCELAPREEAERPPALVLPGDLARVRGTHGETTLDVELERVHAGRVVHGATIAYVLRDVRWAAGHVYHRRVHHRATPVRPRLTRRDARWIERAVVGSTYYGGRYFGHWLTDDVPLMMAACELGQPVVPPWDWTAHQRQYLELLGLAPTVCEQAWVGELTILDDVGANASKRARWEHLRACVRALGPTRTHPGVMLVRGTTGVPRPLVNEAEVADYVAGRGLDVVEAERLDVAELAARVAGARVVIGVEGSQLLHGVFAMADGGTVITLQPPDRFITAIKIYCDALGLRFGIAVGEGSSEGFRVDLDRVARILDLAAGHSAR
jgi:capsular polysaccharide biosynthesis protein